MQSWQPLQGSGMTAVKSKLLQVQSRCQTLMFRGVRAYATLQSLHLMRQHASKCICIAGHSSARSVHLICQQQLCRMGAAGIAASGLRANAHPLLQWRSKVAQHLQVSTKS